MSTRQRVQARLTRNKVAMVGGVYLLAVVTVALLAPSWPLTTKTSQPASRTSSSIRQASTGLAPTTWDETSPVA